MMAHPVDFAQPTHMGTGCMHDIYGAGANTANANAFTSSAYISANRALFFPYEWWWPNEPIKKLWCYNGATASGNVDVGIYTRGGRWLTSIGSTAQAGTNTKQEFDIADIYLQTGLYYFAIAMDNTTGTLFRKATNANVLAEQGALQMASAFPLPNTTVTFAAMASAYAPLFGWCTSTTV